MDAFLGIVIIVGVVTAFIAPMYYCKQGMRTDEIINQKHKLTMTTGSPTVRIKITHPYERCLNAVSPTYNDNPIIVEKENTIMTNSELNPSKIEIQRSITPSELPRTHRKFHKPCFSLKNSETVDSNDRREYAGNASTESGSFGGTKIVTVDVHAKNSLSVNKESLNSAGREPTCTELHCDVKSRKFSTVVSEKWKKLRNSLSYSRSRSTSFQIINETDETERLSIPAFNCHSSVDHSVFHRCRRMVDVSTSTQISSNVQNSNECNKVVSRHDSRKTMKTSFDSDNEVNDNQVSDVEILQDISLLINSLSHLQEQQSIHERSICNVQITGLVLNRSKLLELLRANDRKSRSVSIVGTDNASTISIKFHGHRRRNEPKIPEDVGLLYECPLKRLYKNLPGKFENTKLTRIFHSEERSNKCSSKEIPSSLKDESSYEDIPEIEKAIIADEELFMEKKTLVERLRERFCALFC